ncbi:esterase E4-like [Cloeon dipterum]|uniref:esterase E4-like n=1 Tax=Cloeon dipterum TaxID=197152 RepID=UPI00321F6E73
MKLHGSVLVALFSLLQLSTQQRPKPRNSLTVTIKQGTLTGKVMQSLLNKRDFSAFQGIPYAVPPVGNLRFTDPVEHKGWKGTLMATQEGNDCSQYNHITRIFSGSEDCLFLNVYTPQIKSKRPLPVMVWIHGGGMVAESSSAQLTGPEILMDKDIVLVTLNYRLGLVGLLNLGTKDLHGNYLIRDQILALKWVQKNIAAFGGDPNSVTLFGWSAGAASIHFMLISPLAKGLYHKAILQSGCALNDWAFQANGFQVYARAVENLGCGKGGNEEKLKCLRGLDIQKLVDEASALTVRERRRDPAVSLESANKREVLFKNHDMLALPDVPIMAGVTTREGMLNMILLRPLDLTKEFTENRDFYVPRLLGLKRNTSQFENAWKQISTYYKSMPVDETEQYLLMASDAEYTLGVDWLVRDLVTKKNRKSPVFYYQLSFNGSITSLIKSRVPTNRTGISHGDDLGYLFTMNISDSWQRAPARDRAFISQITTLWANFAEKGNPTPDATSGVKWLPVRKSSNAPEKIVTSYLDLGEKLVMNDRSLNDKRMQFWIKLIREYSVYFKGHADVSDSVYDVPKRVKRTAGFH